PRSLDVPKRPSPATPRTARKLKTPGSDSDSASSPNPVSKTPKDRSPKVVDRKSPRIPAIEKKRPSKVSELEPRIAQLQEELKKAKDQLSSSESSKRRAQQEVEEAKEQLAAMTSELDETRKQLKEISESEIESRSYRQHSLDSTALASAMNEVQKLKIQLDRVCQSEASQARHAESAHAEIQSLRLELTETLVLVEKLKEQLNDSRESEARAIEELSRAQMQLEVVKNTEGTLKSEHANAMELYNSLLMELEQSKDRVNSLEELVANLQADLENQQAQRDTELEIKLQKSESVLEDLRASLLDKEARLQILAEENEKLKSEITKRKLKEAKQIKRPLL
ncbi:UNVERIFIED_CONTAM: Interactor of constitutive active ROPs 2, chloroplastic, partial [Sesamum radiatum]